MPFKRSSMRYGHIVGYTRAIYHEDGERLLTVGQDGDLRIWETLYDDDQDSTCMAENLWTVLQYGDRVLIATDLNTVQAYKFPQLEKDGIEFRFTAFVTSLVKNDRYLAAGSEDGTIKVKRLGDGGGEEFELGGLDGPVLSMDLSPKNLLAASSGDGKLRVWELDSKKLVKTVEDLRKVKSFEGNMFFGTPSFEPLRGNLLAYPKGDEIVVLSTKTWEQKKVLKQNSSNITCGAFSPRGEFYAAATITGEVVVWDYEKAAVLGGQGASVEANPLISLVWNPTNNGEVVLCDSNGQVGNVSEIYIDQGDDDENDLIEMAEKEATGVVEDDGMDDLDIDEMYSKHVVDKKVVADESGDEDEQDYNIQSQFGHINGDADGDSDQKDDLLSDKPLAAGSHRGAAVNGNDDDDASDNDDDARSAVSGRFSAKSYPMQNYFQSGSTPNLEHRYLVYNHVGIVRAHSDEKENSIELEFHDSTKHHGMHMINFMNHTMAGLSESVLAMACPVGEENKSSKLVCINLVAFGNREWCSTMSETEDIIGVVASDKIVAVITDARLLRIYTSKGTQREVVSLPGAPVSMAAYGDHILVAYHRAPASEDQHLNLMIITCVNYRLRCREVPVPLSPGSELRWIGYTDKGSPVIYDSEGIMRLYHAGANLWMPVFNAEERKIGASDSLFIVKVMESTQHIHFIVCRGARYPLTNPRPIPMSSEFKVPLCETDGEQGSLEAVLLQSIYLKSDDADRVLKETAVKLFAYACRVEMEPRAKELVETIASSALIPLVCKYARKINRVHLAENLAAMVANFQEAEKEEERHEMEIARENAAMVSELEHINLEAVTKKDNTPKIKPKPVTMRKNPFKRDSNVSSSPATPNPLEHLTANAIGFPSPAANVDKQRSKNDDDDNSTESSTVENNENRPTNNGNGSTPAAATPGTGQKFLPWFESNKAQLKEDHPNASDSELTKIGLRQFRTLNSYLSPANGAGEKRKRADEGEQAESGVSKLAKFGFVKK